jgi:hypothetical protein
MELAGVLAATRGRRRRRNSSPPTKRYPGPGRWWTGQMGFGQVSYSSFFNLFPFSFSLLLL